MIREIQSDRPTFKRLKFGPGLNIVLAQRTTQSSEHEKRNAVGKSSLVDVVHFMLGGDKDKQSSLSAPELADDIYRLTLDLGSKTTTVARRYKDPARILIEGDFSVWPITPDVNRDTGEVTATSDTWKDLLGRMLVGLPPKSQLEKGTFLTFRSCISYFARRQRREGYSDWRRFDSKQAAVDFQVNLAFLLGLDTAGPLAIHRVKEREKAKKELRKALREGLLGLKVQTPGALKTQHRRTKSQIERLEEQLDGFRVVDAYEQLEDRANELQREIDELSNANVLDRGLISDIADALKAETAPGILDLKKVYEEAGVVLPDVSLARYEDVKKFHTAVVSNRKAHLEAEEHDAKARVEARDKDRRKLSEERNHILETLNSGGALSQYRRLDKDLSQKRAELETLTTQVDLAERFESLRADLRVERAEAERQLQNDLHERRTITESAMEIFEKISLALYDDPATLEFKANQHGLDIDINKNDIGSLGVRRAQIFTFDLTLSTVCAKRKCWPGFLIHDSHIFDGVDVRSSKSSEVLRAPVSIIVR